jgi:biopolymer transport protein TolR
VQGERIASLAEVRASPDNIIAPLRAALKRPSLIGQVMTEKQIAAREITVMADKSTPFAVLKKVMGTCTDADYGRLSFALMEKEKAVNIDQLRRKL